MLVILLVKFFQKRYCTSLQLYCKKVNLALKVYWIVCKFAGFEVLNLRSRSEFLLVTYPKLSVFELFFFHLKYCGFIATSLSYKYF